MISSNQVSFVRASVAAVIMSVSAVASTAANASITLVSYAEDATSFSAVYAFSPTVTLFDAETTGLGSWTATLTQTYSPADPILNPVADFTFAWAGAHLATPHAAELPLLLADLGTCTISAGSLTGTFCDTTTAVPHVGLYELLDPHYDEYHFWLDLVSGGGYAYLTGTHVGEVPVPAGAWLFASGLAGIVSLGRRNRLPARG